MYQGTCTYNNNFLEKAGASVSSHHHIPLPDPALKIRARKKSQKNYTLYKIDKSTKTVLGTGSKSNP